MSNGAPSTTFYLTEVDFQISAVSGDSQGTHFNRMCHGNKYIWLDLGCSVPRDKVITPEWS